MKKRTLIRTLIIVFTLLVAFVGLTSCSKSSNTLYMDEASAGSKGCMGCAGGTSVTKYEWLVNKIENNVETSVATYLNYVQTNNPTEYEAEAAKKDEIKLNGKTYNNGTDEITTASFVSNLKSLIGSYAKKNVIAGKEDDESINKNYQVAQINAVQVRYFEYVDSNKATKASVSSIEDLKSGINGAAGCFDTKTESHTLQSIKEVESVDDVYRLAALYVLEVDTILANQEPIRFKGDTAGEFFSHLWNNLFVFPIAWLLYIVSKLLGGYYAIGLIVATLLVRTIGWPIYAKSNDMSSKMNDLQPELQKLQEKYAGRDDPDSKRMMQMEQAQLYRKNGVGFGGCLLPFLQFPIFMAIFRAISRIPYTKTIEGTRYTLNWANELKPSVFGINLFESRNIGGTGQLIGVIVLALLVVATQILSQLLMQRRQKKAKEHSMDNIPEYRRKAYAQTQNQSQSTMKIMMWGMTIMMGFFVWTSKAGLGLYWLIGNLYSLAQTQINAAQAEKKKAKKAEEANRNRGIFTVNNNDKKKKKH